MQKDRRTREWAKAMGFNALIMFIAIGPIIFMQWPSTLAQFLGFLVWVPVSAIATRKAVRKLTADGYGPFGDCKCQHQGDSTDAP